MLRRAGRRLWFGHRSIFAEQMFAVWVVDFIFVFGIFFQEKM